MGFWDGIGDTFGDLGTAFMHMFPGGWTKPEIDAVVDDGKKVDERIDKGVPWYSAPVETFTGVSVTQGSAIISWVIVGFLLFLVIRD